jgi:hypothetical protein
MLTSRSLQLVLVLLAGELNNLVEYPRDAQQPCAVSRREPTNKTAKPLRTIGMAPGDDRLAIRGEGTPS